MGTESRVNPFQIYRSSAALCETCCSSSCMHIDPHRERIRWIMLIKKGIWCVSNSCWVARELVRQQAPRPATFLFCGICVASAGHALRLWATPSRRARCVQICRHTTETIAASIDASDGKLGGVACGCACLERSFSVEGGLVSRQQRPLRTALPVRIVEAANRMVDVDLALAAWRR